MESDGKIFAPWTPEQVDALNAWQERGDVHPFTCGNDHGHQQQRVLFATTDGWRCDCGYTQKWAHSFMAGPTNNTLRLQLEADAGAVPGCTTECARAKAELDGVWAALPGCRYMDPPDGGDVGVAEQVRRMAEECASLRADAEAVRAVDEWTKAGRRYVRWIYARKWEAYDYADNSHTFAPDLRALGRALMARKEGTNG